MAEDNFIQSVQDSAGDAPQSIGWYRDKIREFGKPAPLDLIRDGRRTAKVSAFNLNMFVYDPKYKKTLPYYDTFPLVLPLEKYSDGFLGINLNYLPIPLRIRLLDRLVDFSNDTDFDETTRLIVEYRKVKNIRLVKPTIHKYLAGQVKSQFRRIDADEFMIATLLPVQRFKKSTAKAVWSDSRSMV